MPRLLASASLLIVAHSLWSASYEVPAQMVATMGAFGSGSARLEMAAGALAVAGLSIALAPPGRFWQRERAPEAASARPHGIGRDAMWMLGLSVGIAAAGLIGFGTDPVLAAAILQPAPTVLFAAAGMMCGGTLLLYAGQRTRVPILFLVFALAAALAILRTGT